MSIMVATGRAARAGVLFRDAEAIEQLRKIDTLIVDKTGTLTEGRPAFRAVMTAPGFEDDSVLTLATLTAKLFAFRVTGIAARGDAADAVQLYAFGAWSAAVS